MRCLRFATTDSHSAARLLSGPLARTIGESLSDPARRFLERVLAEVEDSFDPPRDPVRREGGGGAGEGGSLHRRRDPLGTRGQSVPRAGGGCSCRQGATGKGLATDRAACRGGRRAPPGGRCVSDRGSRRRKGKNPSGDPEVAFSSGTAAVFGGRFLPDLDPDKVGESGKNRRVVLGTGAARVFAIFADFRAQRPQVKYIERRTDEQDHWIQPDQRLDEPEAEVRKAPNADLLRLPAPDEQPLQEDGKDSRAEKYPAASQHRPDINVDKGSYISRNPLVA